MNAAPSEPSPPVPLPPTPARESSWIEKVPHSWAHVPEHQGNCDGLPDHLTPSTGCPECGSAWLDVTAVAFSSDCARGLFREQYWRVEQIGGLEPVMAVRLRCFSGHLIEFDGKLLSIVVMPPLWSTLALGAIGAVILMPYLCGMKKP